MPAAEHRYGPSPSPSCQSKWRLQIRSLSRTLPCDRVITGWNYGFPWRSPMSFHLKSSFHHLLPHHRPHTRCCRWDRTFWVPGASSMLWWTSPHSLRCFSALPSFSPPSFPLRYPHQNQSPSSPHFPAQWIANGSTVSFLPCPQCKWRP